MSRPNNKSLLKDRNRTLVIRTLQLKPGSSRQELADITKLSFPTVSKIVQSLMEEGVVRETGVLESTGGRCPDLLAVNPDFGNIFGLDIEVNYISMTITDFCHKPLATEVVTRNIMPLSNGEINDHIKSETNKFFEKHRALFKKVKCAGIGLCGYSAQDGRVIASNTYYFHKLALSDIIPQNIPCFIDNNANVAALREQAIGLAFDKTNFVCIFIGETGVGSGIVLDGRLFTGANGRAGEFGSSRRLWPDLPWETPDMDTFIKLAARVAGLDYQLFDPERVYICGNLPNEMGKIKEEVGRVFEIYGTSFKDTPLVEVVDIGPCGVAVGATVLARQCFLGSVEFASDVDLWRRMSLSA